MQILLLSKYLRRAKQPLVVLVNLYSSSKNAVSRYGSILEGICLVLHVKFMKLRVRVIVCVHQNFRNGIPKT